MTVTLGSAERLAVLDPYSHTAKKAQPGGVAHIAATNVEYRGGDFCAQSAVRTDWLTHSSCTNTFMSRNYATDFLINCLTPSSIRDFTPYWIFILNRQQQK